MADKEFAKGLYINPTALTKDLTTSKTHFVFFTIGIKKNDLIDYLQNKPTNEQGYINLDVKRSANGSKFYAEINNYQAEDKQIESNRSTNKGKSIGEDTSVFGKPPRNDDNPEDEVPF